MWHLAVFVHGLEGAIAPIDDGVQAMGSIGHHQACLYDGASFVSSFDDTLLDLNPYGFDALLNVSLSTDVAELSPAEVMLYENLIFSGICSGADCN